MIHSVRTKLVLWVGLLVVVSLVALGWASIRLAEHEYIRIEEVNHEAGMMATPAVFAPLRSRIEAHVQQYQWQHLDELMVVISEVLSEHAADDWVVLLFDGNNRLRSSTLNPDAGINVTLADDDLLTVSVAGNVAEIRTPLFSVQSSEGTLLARWLLLEPLVLESELSPGQLFVEALNRKMLMAIAIAGIIALTLTYLMGSRLLRPVADMTHTARRMAAGALDQRVSDHGQGELGELSHAFNRMAQSLQDLEQARQDMINDVAHELRTPLTNVQCQLDAVRDGLMKPDERTINSIHEEVLLLSRLVDDLRDLALASDNQLSLVPEQLSLHDEVQRAIDAGTAGQNSLPTVINAVQESSIVFADAFRFQQILRNLLANAIRHTPREGHVTVSTAEDLVRAQTTVVVTDTGPGIPADQQAHIFNRFYRTDQSRSRISGGAGLGLAIVKQLVEAHGGDIRVHSESGMGAAFIIRLPGS